jgi:serine/threonine-protein kinase
VEALRTRVWNYGKILLLAGALAGTFFLFAGIAMRVAVRAREVTVPNLIGKSVADATAELSALDLQVRVDEGRRPDPKVPAGHVLGQEPTPGSPARRQRSIRVWLSAGAHIARAPSLLGETQRSAEIRLAQDGLFVGSVSEIRSAFYPPDIVVAQDPPASTETSEVRLLVNRGEDRAAYVMPDLIGLNGDRAADVMRNRGFRVSITAREASPSTPPGVVVRQTPAGGYQVHPGDAIALEVSR